MVAPGWSAEEEPFSPSPEWPTGHYARIETDYGRIVARLLPRQAPQSVAYFVAAARGELSWTDPTGEQKKFPYYDGIPIHNVRAGLLFEAGDWTGTGQGAPPLYVPDEGGGPINFSQPGRLGMARPQKYASALQFFATAASSPRLNRAFPCFGEILEGREVVFQISQQDAYSNGKPIEEIKIRSIRIFELGSPPPLPEPRQTPRGPKKLEIRKELLNRDK
jgi:peptidyl-prolyl cis-trans isomerase A (cyclophilin A)